MVSYRCRRRSSIAVSLVAQAIFLIWRWHSPGTPAGSASLWAFPGYVIVWWAPTRWMFLSLALMVLANVAYHLVLGAVIGAGWRLVRRAV
jgi:hypothetical protein